MPIVSLAVLKPAGRESSCVPVQAPPHQKPAYSSPAGAESEHAQAQPPSVSRVEPVGPVQAPKSLIGAAAGQVQPAACRAGIVAMLDGPKVWKLNQPMSLARFGRQSAPAEQVASVGSQPMPAKFLVFDTNILVF